MKKEHFEIVLEDINNKMSNISEGLQGLDKKIDDVKIELKSDIKDLHDEMIVRFDYLDKKLDNTTENHEQRITILETKVA